MLSFPSDHVGHAMMKRVVIGIVLGAAAGVIGVIFFELTNQQIWGWLTTAVLLGIASQLPRPAAAGRLLWLGGLGGCIIVGNWALSKLILYYPIWKIPQTSRADTPIRSLFRRHRKKSASP